MKKKSEPKIPEKIKTAIRILIDQPALDLEAAAKAIGFSTYRLRGELKKGHIRRYFWHEKRAALDAICAGNPMAMKRIRDSSGNDMASVQAAKALEAMRSGVDDESRSGVASATTPGLTIQILTAGNAAPMRVLGQAAPTLIDARPAVHVEDSENG